MATPAYKRSKFPLQLQTLRNPKKKVPEKFDRCPKCTWRVGKSKDPSEAPGGVEARIILDASPSPQILLAEDNTVVYANSCAGRIFHLKEGALTKDEEAKIEQAKREEAQRLLEATKKAAEDEKLAEAQAKKDAAAAKARRKRAAVRKLVEEDEDVVREGGEGGEGKEGGDGRETKGAKEKRGDVGGEEGEDEAKEYSPYKGQYSPYNDQSGEDQSDRRELDEDGSDEDESEEDGLDEAEPEEDEPAEGEPNRGETEEDVRRRQQPVEEEEDDLADEDIDPHYLEEQDESEGRPDSLIEDPLQAVNDQDEDEDMTILTGLEGYSIEYLNLQLVEEDIRRWVTISQVLEDIKYNLGKRHLEKGEDVDLDSEDIYGELMPDEMYDYYGESVREREMQKKREKRRKEKKLNSRRALRDTTPVLIMRKDGEGVPATMYISLVDPGAPSYSYTALSFIPGIGKLEATFIHQILVKKEEEQAPRERKRDKLKKKLAPLHRPNFRRRREEEESEEDEELQMDIIRPEDTVGDSSEDILRRARFIKDLILDEMEYCFIAMSPEGDIVITNTATRAVLGKETMAASMGHGFEWIARLDIWRPDFSERLPFEEWALNRLIRENKPLTQVIGMHAGGVELVVELRGKCIWKDPEKEEGLLAALAIVVDQSKWFTRERKLRNHREQQETFITAISRELKTPVAGIIGLLELLYATRENLSPEQLGYIQRTFGSVNSLLLVINDIIDYNRVVIDDVSTIRNAFILQDLVEELETLFSESMGKECVDFEVDMSGINRSAFGDGTRLVLHGDGSKIRRIAINMLSNAFKFTPRGKVTMRVSTKVAPYNSFKVLFEVEDTGVGISPEDKEKIFAPFDETSERTIGVDGIGLKIARKFVSSLSGDIGCQSVVGQGTKFWFSVPCGRPPPGTQPTLGPKEKTLAKTMGIAIHFKDLAPEGAEEKESKTTARAGACVLIVEDNWNHLMVTERRLQRIGCEVLSAVSGRDALTVLKKRGEEVDLILMDIQMPLLDGFETTKMIREESEYSRWQAVPVVGITAMEGFEDRKKAQLCGLNDFLVKPLTTEGVKELVEKFTGPMKD